MRRRTFLALLVATTCSQALLAQSTLPRPQYKPTVRLSDELTVDPDDMCFLQTSPKTGLIVVSDKSASRVFLFDDAGRKLDSVAISKPGNIDVRSDFSFGQTKIPLIIVNQRETEPQLRALTITGPIEKPKLKVLKSEMPTGPNYGGCLYHSKKDGRFYFFSTVKGGIARQFELTVKDQVVISKRVRSWQTPICEGAVADDEAGVVFVAEEDVGIRKLGAEPNQSTVGQLILKVGQNQVTGDLEGITLYPTGPKTGYLIASDQQSNCFIVLDRMAPHRFLGAFSVMGAADTDGIDLATFGFGPKFPNGAFACHTDLDQPGKSVLLVPLPQMQASFGSTVTQK